VAGPASRRGGSFQGKCCGWIEQRVYRLRPRCKPERLDVQRELLCKDHGQADQNPTFGRCEAIQLRVASPCPVCCPKVHGLQHEPGVRDWRRNVTIRSRTGRWQGAASWFGFSSSNAITSRRIKGAESLSSRGSLPLRPVLRYERQWFRSSALRIAFPVQRGGWIRPDPPIFTKRPTAMSSPPIALPSDIANSLQYLDDVDLHRLKSAVEAETARRKPGASTRKADEVFAPAAARPVSSSL